MNVDRMRRYVARNTPDEIKTRFDPIEDDVQQKYEAWVHKFMCKMKIKHGGDVTINVYMEDSINKSFTKLVIARVVEKKPMQEEQNKLRLDLASLPHGFVERQIARRRFI